jgi:hypothetical protein
VDDQVRGGSAAFALAGALGFAGPAGAAARGVTSRLAVVTGLVLSKAPTTASVSWTG